MQTSDLNPFMVENVNFDQEINAKVREVNEFELETLAKVVEIIDPYFNSTIDAMERFECGPEIPILLVDKDKQNFIMRSNKRKNVFNWDLYQKVSDIKMRDKFGYETTLEQFLAEASQVKVTTAPLRYRPIPTMIQAGQIITTNAPTTIQPIDITTIDVEASTMIPNTSMCNDDIIKTRPPFPTYSSNDNQF